MSVVVLGVGRRPPQRVEEFVMPASKNQNNFGLHCIEL